MQNERLHLWNELSHFQLAIVVPSEATNRNTVAVEEKCDNHRELLDIQKNEKTADYRPCQRVYAQDPSGARAKLSRFNSW